MTTGIEGLYIGIKFFFQLETYGPLTKIVDAPVVMHRERGLLIHRE